MINRVVWTEEALADAEQIVNYVLFSFGGNVARRAIEDLQEDVDLLRFFPFRGMAMDNYPPYRVLHTKRNSIIYVVHENMIEITSIRDNRRDDKTIKDILKTRNKQ